MRIHGTQVGSGCNDGIKGGIPQKPKDYKKTIKELVGLLYPQRFKIILAAFFVVLSVVFSVVSPKILGTVTTQVFNWVTQGEELNFNAIWVKFVLLGAFYILSTLFMYVQNYMMTIISENMVYDLRIRLEEKINRIPVSTLNKKGIGEVQSRVTNDVNSISSCISDSLSQVVKAVVTIAGVVIVIFTSNFILATIVVSMIPLGMIVTFFITKVSQKYYSENQRYTGKYNNHIEEAYSNLLQIKAYNYIEIKNKRFNELNETMKEKSFKAVVFSGMIVPMLQFMENINYVVIAIIGCYMVSKNAIQIGDVQAFIQYSKQFNQPINQLANVSSIIQSTLAAAERVFEFLEEEEEEDLGIKDAELKNVKGEISFNNVSFAYDSQKVIDDLSIKIDSGQTVALVGATGSGKTTLVNLLMRFYDINSGSIEIGGVNIKDISREKLRDMISMVLQDSWLFSGTIYDNIAYGMADCTKEDVVNAAKTVGIHDFISGLTDGYDTVINEMTNNLSAGQKQLITIARAFLKEPSIFIFDEATSSVDTRTELLIQNALTRILENRTCFIIAHRLSTIISADVILVLQNGKIVESGTHKELLNKKGYYYELYNSQF